jgi:GDP-L-fucose synthase
MRALVTGGAGFVGRHLCHALLQAGWDVTCVDPIVPRTGGMHPTRWPLFDPLKHRGFRFLELDCRSYFTSDDGPFDCAFHLAAMVGGRMMIEHDPLAVAEDLSIDAEFFRYCVSARPKKIVFFSSSAAYPIHLQTHRDYTLLKEDMITFAEGLGMPDLSYGWAKLTGEYLARLAHDKYDLDVICYRPFSGYGEDQDLSYPFPSICQRAYQNKGAEKLKVWGTGDQMRDFIHITDCISFVLESMGSFSDGSAINLSTGRLTSFKEFAKIAAATCGYVPDIVGTSDKPEGVFARGGDRTLQDALGLNPTISFESGVERGVDYFARAAA